MPKIKMLEAIFNLEKNNLKGKEDALILVVHSVLCNNGFECLGNLNDEISGEGSELLPKDWNANPDVYNLKYTKSGKKYLLKAVPADDLLLVNWVDIKKSEAFSANLKTEKFIDDLADFKSLLKNDDELVKEIVEKLINEGKSEKKEKPQPQADPLRTARPPIDRPSNQPYPDLRDLRDPFGYGQGDLDPLRQGGGGGMIFDPWNRQQPAPEVYPGASNMPRGSIPPGARYDPIGPLRDPLDGFRPGRGRYPDFPPPDFDDFS